MEECQSNLTLTKCGCVQFYLPSTETISLQNLNLTFFFFFVGEKTTRICGLSDLQCYYDILMLFVVDGSDIPAIKACGCMSDCISFEYEIKVVETTFRHDDQYIKVGNSSYWIGSVYYAGLAFDFGDTQYHAITRYANDAATGFLSNIGGLLSLFLGVSVMSLVEIFYFFVVRVAVELMKYIKRKRSHRVGYQTDLSTTLNEII